VSVTEKVVPSALMGAGGFVVTAVATRSGMGPTTSTVVVTVNSPRFSHAPRIQKVLGPGESAVKYQVADRLSVGTMLPSVRPPRALGKFIVTPSRRIVWM
jgi:hypothetical protein